MPEMKENFNQHDSNDTVEQMQIEHPYINPSEYVNFFSQNLVFIRIVEKKKGKKFQC